MPTISIRDRARGPFRALRRVFHHLIGGGILMAVLAGATPASATIVDWNATAGWSVAVDTTFTPRSCFAAAEFEGGTYFRIGVDPSDATLYVVIANDRWESLEEGGTYPLLMNFGDETPWGFDMHAGAFPNGGVFLISFTDDWRLLDEFAGQSMLHVAYGADEIAVLDLSGSPEALASVLECQRAMDENARPARTDPFAVPPVGRDSPFSP